MPTFILSISLPRSAYADLRKFFRFAEISFTYLPMSANADKFKFNSQKWSKWAEIWYTWSLGKYLAVTFIIFEKFYFGGLGWVSSAKIRLNPSEGLEASKKVLLISNFLHFVPWVNTLKCFIHFLVKFWVFGQAFRGKSGLSAYADIGNLGKKVLSAYADFRQIGQTSIFYLGK